jgi:ABC-type Fe3+-siderophore transport system permease subunit
MFIGLAVANIGRFLFFANKKQEIFIFFYFPTIAL